MWEEAWNMEFYPLKCQQITFLCKRQPAEQSLYLHDTMIPKAEQIKYLEVTFDTKTNWNAHINNIASRGNSILSFKQRNVLTRVETVKTTAYKQLPRPVLEMRLQLVTLHMIPLVNY